jgi:hypothetical protein
LGHVIFVGRDFATWKGANNCKDAVKLFQTKVQPGTLIICPWGDDGAAFGIGGVDNSVDVGDKEVTKIDAFPPIKIIDSLGECFFIFIYFLSFVVVIICIMQKKAMLGLFISSPSKIDRAYQSTMSVRPSVCLSAPPFLKTP